VTIGPVVVDSPRCLAERVIVDKGRVTGLIDFAEASAQPADIELDTILRWCAKAREYPPAPDEQGLYETTRT
jgi:hygromycin-B 7''-O-kinase